MEQPNPKRATREIEAADLAIQDPPTRHIPDEAVPAEVQEFLRGGGIERWLEGQRRERDRRSSS
jgi:hypothetical protein